MCADLAVPTGRNGVCDVSPDSHTVVEMLSAGNAERASTLIVARRTQRFSVSIYQYQAARRWLSTQFALPRLRKKRATGNATLLGKRPRPANIQLGIVPKLIIYDIQGQSRVRGLQGRDV